jgi:DNA-binding PadR family transcriptional regulator
MIEVIEMQDKHEIIKNLNQELRKGTLVLAVLSQLKEKHYGYSLVESLNKKGLRIEQNTLYPLLRRLDKQGLLESTWEVVEPRPRKYYQLNNTGKEILLELSNTYKDNYKTIISLLKEEL